MLFDIGFQPPKETCLILALTLYLPSPQARLICQRGYRFISSILTDLPSIMAGHYKDLTRFLPGNILTGEQDKAE